MKNIKYLSIIFISVILYFGISSVNADYKNCMKASKHSYISKEGADHIAAQCEAFIKDKVMVK